MHYHLKNKKSKEETGVNICKRLNGKMFKYSTGLKVRPKYWDTEKKKVLKGEIDYLNKNQFLKNLNTKFDSIVLSLKVTGDLSHENIREQLDEFIGRVRKTADAKPEKFEEIWRDKWMVSLMKSRGEKTVAKKGYVLNSLQDFHRDTKYPLTLNSINRMFAEKYKEWALAATKLNGDYRYTKDNSIHKNISITKEFMKWANGANYTSNIDYTNIKGYNEEYYAPFALSHDDINELMHIDFDTLDLDEFGIRPCNHSKTKLALEKTRDAFVFRSLCGIRFSDYHTLTPLKLQEGTIKLVTHKTSTQIQLPLHDYAKQLLIKHDYKVPKLKNQNENRNLKLLGQIVGFDESVVVVYKRGGKKIEEIKKRWELMTTHTARKTFITNCLRAGIDAYLVMEIVGIKKESTFKRYVQVASQDIDKAMGKLELFYAS